MNPKTATQIAEGNFTRNMTTKGRNWKDATVEWAGGLKETVRDGLKKTGYETEAYVRSHPGRIIAGACCVGLAAGFLLGRSSARKR